MPAAKPWIKVERGIVRNIKILKFGKELGLDPKCAVGMLVCFWQQCIETRATQYGDLRSIGRDGVELFAEWEGEPGKFVDAMVRYGLIDETDEVFAIHDWMTYAGAYLNERDANTKRKSESRAAEKAPKLPRKRALPQSSECPAGVPEDTSGSVSDSCSSRDPVRNWDQGEAPAAPEVASQLAGPLASPLPPIPLDRDQHEPCQAAREPEVVTPIVEGPTPCEQRALAVASCDTQDKPDLARSLPIDQIWSFLVNDLRVANGVFPRADVLGDLRKICGSFAVTKRDLCVAYLGAAGWQREQSGSSRVHVRTVVSFLHGNLHQEHKPSQPALPGGVLTQSENLRRAAPRYTFHEEARQRAIEQALPALQRSNNLRDEILAEERAAKQKAEV